MSLDRLFSPRSIAFIGGRQAELAIEQCDHLGFNGEIWPVNPSRNELAGRRTYRSIADLPAPPDAALVAVNRHQTVEVVAALAELGGGGAVCYASGFAEVDDEGRRLQELLVAAAIPVIGPNCYGIINAKLGAALWPDVQGCRRFEGGRGAAIITQSGNIALNLTMNTRGLRFTHVISIGNQAGVTIEDCIEYLAHDPDVAVIGIHAESIVDPIRFGAAAITAHAEQTPLVMLKTGRSATAAHIAGSHTAAVAKPAHVYNALFDRYGVIQVDSVDQMAATLGFLVTAGRPAGNRVVSLSCSGGEASLVADTAARHGVGFAEFTPDQTARLRATLSDLVTITNPLDYQTFIWGDQARLTECFTAALDGPADAALLVLDWPTSGDSTSWLPTLHAIVEAHMRSATPTVVAATLAENMPAPAREHLQRAGIAVAHSLDEAFAALAAAALAGRWLADPPPRIHQPPGSAHHATTTLSEADAKQLLKSSGVDVPAGRRASPPVLGAGGLRFPIVAKASGVAHKTDAGGVILGIADEVALQNAVAALADLSEEILLEEQITDAVAELLLTVRREPPIGTVLVVGSGGTLVELLGDTATALLPLTTEEIHDLLAKLKIGHLIAGHRGRPAANLAAIADTVGNLTELMTLRDDIVEIEINPLLATPTAAVAVDALITLGEANQ
jgi:acetyl-CoA synthetase